MVKMSFKEVAFYVTKGFTKICYPVAFWETQDPVIFGLIQTKSQNLNLYSPLALFHWSTPLSHFEQYDILMWHEFVFVFFLNKISYSV